MNKWNEVLNLISNNSAKLTKRQNQNFRIDIFLLWNFYNHGEIITSEYINRIELLKNSIYATLRCSNIAEFLKSDPQ